MEGLAPPVQPGIHLTTEDGQFKIAVTLRNPTDEPVSLTTMSTKLFSVSLKERTMTEQGTRVLWSPSVMAGQAVTHWELEANSRITKHYLVPNEEAARERARERVEEQGDLLYDTTDPDEVAFRFGPVEPLDSEDEDEIPTDPETVTDDPVHREVAVSPDETGIVKVEFGPPTGRDYFVNVTKQYDLRTRPDRELDDELPEATLDAIENRM